jgi:hypothetical protein
MVSGNTNAPMMAMARRAADLVLEDAQTETNAPKDRDCPA